MSTSPSFQTRKLPLILIFLIGVISASAITFGESIFFLGTPQEGSAFSASSPPIAVNTSTIRVGATVWTDRPDYLPGMTVKIGGSGFAAGEQVRLEVVHVTTTTSADDAHAPFFATADSGGKIVAGWLVDEDSLNQTLELRALGLSSGLQASTTFTDAGNPVSTYSQCANDEGDGYATGNDLGCKWINGNLQSNTATYAEGEATVQRVWLTGFAKSDTTTHTITFKYGTTKGGKHAYDFLTSWDWSEDYITVADLCQAPTGPSTNTIDGCVTAVNSESDYERMKDDPNVPNDTVLNGIEPNDTDDRRFQIAGGVITNVSTPQIFSGDYGSDSESVVTVTFKVPTTASALCTAGGDTPCGVMIFFGAHVSEGVKWTAFNGTTGASTIDGSPYHVAIAEVDGDPGDVQGGGRDNQMQANTVVQPPDLVISKTASNSPINAGDVASFTITVTNNGDGPANNVTLSDPLPAGVAWAITGGTGATFCTDPIVGSTLSCNFGTMAAGASYTVVVSGTTDAADCGTLYNLATAQADNNPPVQDDASIVVNCPDVRVTKVADQDTVTAGTTIGFTITVINDGPGSAAGVTLSDTLPANGGLSWSIDGGTGAANCSIAAGVLSCNFGTLADDATRTVHISSPTTSATCGVVSNTARVAATNEPEANTSNNSASANITVNCPDISVDKTAVQGTVSAGTAIAFNIVVSNLGPGSATGVTLTDTLPSNSGLVWTIDVGNTDAPGCSIAAGVLTCNIGTLAEGASVHVRVTSPTTAATCGTVNNTGAVSATNEDPTKLGNNSDGASILVQCPSLSVTKTADSPLVNAGSPIGFTITVANAGPGTATSVTLSDPLPGGAGVDWSINGGTGAGLCSITGSPQTETLNCNFGDMASGASFTVHVSSNTTAASCSQYPNVATAQATNHAPVTGRARVLVQCPDVSVTKTADAAAVDAPGNVGFTITVYSNGPAPATNVSLSDVLPSNGGLSWSINGGTGAGLCSIGGSPATLTCTFGTMPAGTNYTVHIVSATTGATCGTVNNTATVAANFEPNTGNNSASASEAVRCGTIIIIKNAKPANGVFSFTGTGDNFGDFNLSGSTANNGNRITRTNLIAGNYSATEATQLGWTLTGIGGSSDPNTPYNCVVTGSGGSTGVGVPADRRVNIVLHGGDTVTCTFENTGDNVTRTQGFWATHPNLAIKAWNGGTTDTDPEHTFPGVANTPGIGDNLLCGQPVVFPNLITQNSSDVMGGFWSDISKTSTGGKRSKTDNSRMSLLQQLIAAELNASAFGSSPSSGSFAAWEAAFCSGNASQLQTAQQQAASFNSQGDSGTFTPGTSANSKLGRFLAKYSRWDTLPFGF